MSRSDSMDIPVQVGESGKALSYSQLQSLVPGMADSSGILSPGGKGEASIMCLSSGHSANICEHPLAIPELFHLTEDQCESDVCHQG